MNEILKSFFIALALTALLFFSLYLVNPEFHISQINTNTNVMIMAFSMFFLGSWYVAYIFPKITGSYQKKGRFGPKRFDEYFIFYIIAMFIVDRIAYYLIMNTTEIIYKFLAIALVGISIAIFAFWWKRYYR